MNGKLDTPTRAALLRGARPSTVEVRLGPNDVKSTYVNPLPNDPEKQYKYEFLGYRNMLEKVAERYHTTPGTVVLRMDGGVFFATADALVDQVRVAVLTPGVHSVVLHFAGVNFMDSQGAATVSEIVRMTEASNVELRLAAVRPAVRRVLERQGAVELLGADHIHGNVHRAVAALGTAHSIPAHGPGGTEEDDGQ